jgi:type I restriction enzyme S subunit
MAKGKQQELTLEEKLKQALVPEDEQPYKVPGNWVWTYLGNINHYVGNSLDPLKSPDDNFELYSVPSWSNDYPEIISGADIGSTKQVVEKDDVLLCKINPRINRVWYVAKHTDLKLIASSEWIVIRNKHLKSKYLMLCLSSNYFRELMLSNVSGVGGSLMRAQPKYVMTYPVPLPPLAEQQRIVDRIESLFAKLDQAKELAQNALDTFETRKAAILHKAFTGELTAKWREKNGVDFERDWKERKFSELGKLERGRSQYRPRNAPELFGGDYPFIQTGDVANANVYIVEHKQTLSEFGLKQSKLFPKGTLCITIAANIGDVAILSYDCCFPDSIVGFTPNDLVDSKFIYYFMNIMKDEIEHYAPATAQKNINLKILNDISVKTPPIEEQKEIVLILDRFFEKEQKAKELCDVIDKIDLMKKAILARAFRGELGTNDPSEESAVELLKEVLKDK